MLRGPPPRAHTHLQQPPQLVDVGRVTVTARRHEHTRLQLGCRCCIRQARYEEVRRWDVGGGRAMGGGRGRAMGVRRTSGDGGEGAALLLTITNTTVTVVTVVTITTCIRQVGGRRAMAVRSQRRFRTLKLQLLFPKPPAPRPAAPPRHFHCEIHLASGAPFCASRPPRGRGPPPRQRRPAGARTTATLTFRPLVTRRRSHAGPPFCLFSIRPSSSRYSGYGRYRRPQRPRPRWL